MVDERNPAKTMTGSAGYIAPEVLSSLNKAAYDGTASDMWSVGVILFILYVGLESLGRHWHNMNLHHRI